MNKFLRFLALALLLNIAASAQQSIVSFKSLGHNDEPIYGMIGSSTYFLKIDPQYEVNGSKLVLYFEPSQALMKDHSFINIIIGDKPIYSSRLTNDSVQKVVLNISGNDISQGQFLNVQVKTLLTISGDKCHDLDNPAIWLKVKSYSYLVLNKSDKNFFSNVNISNCFDSKKAVVYPANPTLHDLKAAAWAYARLKKLGRSNILVFEADKKPDSIRNYIMVGNMPALTQDKRDLIKVIPKASQGLFYLYKAITEATDTVEQMVNVKNTFTMHKTPITEKVANEILFITGADDTGLEKAITALGNPNILNSSFGDFLLINKAENSFASNIDQNRTRISLKQLGGATNFMSGIGSLKSIYTFKNSDFSFTPKEVEIHFTATYSGLTPGDRGYFNIYLNGSLISSEKLDVSGKLNSSVVINRYQHHKYNTMEAEFRFYPGTGNCMNTFTNYFAEVDIDKSYLESKTPLVTSNLSFYQYPEAFNNGQTSIVVSEKYAKYTAAAMGEIIYELNNNVNANNYPDFVYSKDFSNADLQKNNIVALLSRDDELMQKFPDAPIKFSDNFSLYNNDKDKVVYSLSDSANNGLAQIFYNRSNNPTLVLTVTGNRLTNAFLSASRSITEQLSTLSSNVCIADADQNKYLFNISQNSDNLTYAENKSKLTAFWESYNLYILLGILVLILLSFLLVRSKIQKSQDMFIE